MPTVPAFLLKKLYVKGSLKTTDEGSMLVIRNTLAPGTITKVSPAVIDGVEYSLEQISIGEGHARRPASEIATKSPFAFGLNAVAEIWIAGARLEPGMHSLAVTVTAKEVGELKIQIEDRL
jgi:hypothetical protein